MNKDRLNKLEEEGFVGADFASKANGKARYIEDLCFPEMDYVRIIRSPLPYGEIRNIISPVLPSGYFFLTAKDIPGKNYVYDIIDDWPILADKVTNYRGEPIALLVGPSPEVLLELSKSVKLEIKPLDPDDGTKVLCKRQTLKGDKRFFEERKPDFVRSYDTGYQEHAYLETQGMVADYHEEDGSLDIYGSMQCPFYQVHASSIALGIDEKKITSTQTTTGGGFGGKEDFPSLLSCLVALGSYYSHKPTKLIFNREEDMLTSSKRHAGHSVFSAYFDADKEIAGIKIEITLYGGAYLTVSSLVLARSVFEAQGVYDFPNLLVNGKVLSGHTAPSGAFRGFGGPQILFPLECFMGDLASFFGMDSLDFKMRHLIGRGGTNSTGGVMLEEHKIPEMVEMIKAMADFPKRKNSWKSDEKTIRSYGFSLVSHGSSLAEGGDEKTFHSKLRLCRTGDDYTIYCSNVDMGQSLGLSSRMYLSKKLGCPLEKVHCSNFSTLVSPDTGPAVASRSMFIVGSLIDEALKKAEGKGDFDITVAYHLPEPIKWDGDKCIGYPYIAISYAALLVFIEIDRVSKNVTVKDVYDSYDIGTPINPLVVQGQIEGGTLQGIGWALYENISLKDHSFQIKSLSSYSPPGPLEAPLFHHDYMSNPARFGPSKGLGELCLVGAAPAIADAINRVAEEHVSRLPMNAEYLRRIIK